MGFSTGSSAASRAARKAKQLKFLQDMRQRTDVLHAMRMAEGSLGSQTVGSGAGLEGSGYQGVSSSLRSQGAANYTLARESGRLKKSMERDMAAAKRGANKVKIGIAVAAAVTGGALGAVGAAAGSAVSGAISGASSGLAVGNFISSAATGNVDSALSSAGGALEGLDSLIKSGKQQPSSGVSGAQAQIENVFGRGAEIVDPLMNANDGLFGAGRSDTRVS